MRVFCAGFNLFGTFRTLPQEVISSFKCVEYNNLIDLLISHYFSIIHEKNEIAQKIFITGFKEGRSHELYELNFAGEDIKNISISKNSALFLTSNGHAWKLVFNSETNAYDLVEETLNDFLEPVDERPDSIVKLASGNSIGCAWTKNQILYNIPFKTDFKCKTIQDICCGIEHCLILLENGFVYSFGGGSRGQLGHGRIGDASSPQFVADLSGIKIIKIACGGWHSAALCSEGVLYVWGYNGNGQLGLGSSFKNTSIVTSPNAVSSGISITDVACGYKHTIALLANNQLVGAGWNKYNQLGLKTMEDNFYEMIPLYDFKLMKVSGLRCGPWNSAVLVSDIER